MTRTRPSPRETKCICSRDKFVSKSCILLVASSAPKGFDALKSGSKKDCISLRLLHFLHSSKYYNKKIRKWISPLWFLKREFLCVSLCLCDSVVKNWHSHSLCALLPLPIVPMPFNPRDNGCISCAPQASVALWWKKTFSDQGSSHSARAPGQP